MLKLNSFLNECCFKGCSMGLKVQGNKNDSPVHRTPGSLDSPVLRTPGSLNSPVHRTPGSHFKMLITQPRSKKNRNSPRTSLMGPGGAVWGKKPRTKNLVRLSL